MNTFWIMGFVTNLSGLGLVAITAFKFKRLSAWLAALMSYVFSAWIGSWVYYFFMPTQTLRPILFLNLFTWVFVGISYLIFDSVFSSFLHDDGRKPKKLKRVKKPSRPRHDDAEYFGTRRDASDVDAFEASLSQVQPVLQSYAFFAVIVVALLFLTAWVTTSFGVKPSYRSINVTNVKHEVAPTLKRNQTPVAITPKTVFNKVSKAMSDVPNSNNYEIAENDDGDQEIQAQYYHGKPVYIVPLQFRGWFKYINNREIPGYFRINATDVNAQPVFVKSEIKYSDSSYFGNNIDRLIYKHNFKSVSLSSNAQLEIDDNGHPYYVKTLYQPGLFDTRPRFNRLRVAVVDAVDGNTKLYKLNQTPKFIDENITSDVADSLNHYFGYYEHGYLNAILSQNDVKKPTENGPEDGVTTIFDGNGRIHYLSDFTSTSASTNSALGYSMIDARTGELKYYNTSGIMDTDGAIDNADKNYHAQNYHAEMPVLYSIDGHAMWVMSVLDSSGLQRGFYYVDGQNPSLHADGDDVTDTLDKFRQVLVQNGGSVKNSDAQPTKPMSGVIERCFVGNSSAVFKLKDKKELYVVSTSDYPKASLMRPGDSVSFAAGTNGTQNTATKFVDNTF